MEYQKYFFNGSEAIRFDIAYVKEDRTVFCRNLFGEEGCVIEELEGLKKFHLAEKRYFYDEKHNVDFIILIFINAD